ncbi:hypothetical protein K466DRAFT_667003 [Polyporus arcularius HHB13444]|uniref:Uncharacterized protein n=1 Tax=Polyporus arcularius HHB13444 TaxID=1314778 RepID=A0A5C3NX19_9APHY|nr:hypothetical protein K466DRAFT_667003 [Polyporus arcularius HHB13444]
MAMSASATLAAAATAFNATVESDTVFAPTTILALVLFLMLTAFLFGAPLFLAIRNQHRGSQVPHRHDIESRHDKDAYAYFEVVDTGPKRRRSASLWLRFTCWVSGSSSYKAAAEPELPSPVYTILPLLRPKPLLHVRTFEALAFWKRDEVKREGFTLTDVKLAKKECEASVRLAGAAEPDHAVKHPRRWWTGLFAFGNIPGILIHPCDGSPAFSYAEEDECTPPHLSPHIPATVLYHAPAPPTPAVDVDSNFSPASTISEPDSPMPATPVSESSMFPDVSPLHFLEVPMPSSTAPAEEMEIDDIINLSSFSGNVFVLESPPHSKEAASWPARTRASIIVACATPNAGLGFEIDEPRPVFVIQGDPSETDDIDDTEHTRRGLLPRFSSSSSSSSANSVPDIASALAEFPESLSVWSTSTRATSPSSRPPRKRDISLSCDFVSVDFSITQSSRSTYYGILGGYSGGSRSNED